MKCPSCTTEFAADASFCPKCGTKFGAAPSAAIPVSQLAASVARNTVSNEPEVKLWEGGYSAKAMIGGWLGAGVASVALIVASVLVVPGAPAFIGILVLIWLGLLVIFAYRKFAIHYELTSQRFIHQTGILTRTSDRIETIDIDDVAFTQSLVERMFNVGTINVTSSDRTHPVLKMIGIDDVKRVADLIDETRRKERRKRGLHIENI